MQRQSANHSHSLRWERKTSPWEFQAKLLHCFFMSNNKSNIHSLHLRRIILKRSTAKLMLTIQESNIDKLVKIMSSWLEVAKCSNQIQKLETIVAKLSKRQSLRMASFCVNHLRLEVCIKKASHRVFSMLLQRHKSQWFSEWDNWQTEKKGTEQIQLNFAVRCSANCCFLGLRLEADFQFLSDRCRAGLDKFVSKSWAFQCKRVYLSQRQVLCRKNKRLLQIQSTVFAKVEKIINKNVHRSIIRSWFIHCKQKNCRIRLCVKMILARNRRESIIVFLRWRSSKALYQGRRRQIQKYDLDSVMLLLSRQTSKGFDLAHRHMIMRGTGVFMRKLEASHPEHSCVFAQKRRFFYLWEEVAVEASKDAYTLQNCEQITEHGVRRCRQWWQLWISMLALFFLLWLIIAFITWNSKLVPLLEGLCSLNPCKFEILFFGGFAGIEPSTSGVTVLRSDQLS